jgi:C_GCAxxG_C_C family probable redox protein
MQVSEVIEVSLKEYLARHYAHCSELLFKNVTEAWTKDFDPGLVRIATPFGGGLAGMQDVCGALAGGCMAIGYLCGRRTFQDDGKLSWQLAENYYHAFKSYFGDTTCRHIRGRIVDWNSHVKCSATVKDSITLLWNILERAAAEGKISRY